MGVLRSVTTCILLCATGLIGSIGGSLAQTTEATQYLIVAKSGVSNETFHEYTSTLPQSSDDQDVALDDSFIIGHVARLDDTALQEVKENALVDFVVPNIHGQTSNGPRFKGASNITTSSSATLASPSPKASQSKKGKRTLTNTRSPNPQAFFQPSNLLTRGPSAVDLPTEYLNRLGHLELLSSKWFDDSLESQYNGQEFVSEQTLGQGINVYIVDDGVNLNHVEFQGNNPLQIVAQGVDISRIDGSHGTGVASLAVGRYLGVASRANLISVAHDVTNEATTMWSLDWVYSNIVQGGLQGKCVINMSFGGHIGNYDVTNDWYHRAFDAFRQLGCVVVVAAGNDGDNNDDVGVNDGEDLFSDIRPASYASRHPNVIAVGAVDKDGIRTDFSPKCEIQDLTSNCITAYAQGGDVTTADVNGQDLYTTKSGTSFAAPIVAGLAAYFMSHPNQLVRDSIYNGNQEQVGENVSRLIQELSFVKAQESIRVNSPLTPMVTWNGVIVNWCKKDTPPSIPDGSNS